jgi:hypothetical protein
MTWHLLPMDAVNILVNVVLTEQPKEAMQAAGTAPAGAAAAPKHAGPVEQSEAPTV